VITQNPESWQCVAGGFTSRVSLYLSWNNRAYRVVAVVLLDRLGVQRIPLVFPARFTFTRDNSFS